MEIEGDFKIYDSQDNIAIQHIEYKKVLVIDKNSGQISEQEQSILSQQTIFNITRVYAILGILDVKKYNFLIYVEKSELVGSIEGAEIFKVMSINFVPLFDTKSRQIPTQIESFQSNLKNLLTMGFYYSFNYDLTNPRQKQVKYKLYNIIDGSDKNFFWNYALNKKFFESKVDQGWSVVCIFGYVNIANIMVGDENTTFTLISRRSVRNAGTRYNARGINEAGHVANFVETEQMLKVRKLLFTVCIIRGSVPIYFEQNSLHGDIKLLKGTEANSKAFVEHMRQLQSEYKYLMMVNLLQEGKNVEEILTEGFKNMVLSAKLNNCKYDSFDMHAECKGDNYGNLELHIENKLQNILANFKYYLEDGESAKFHEQTGVFRINCLDCLDRTNIFQARLCWQILLNQVGENFI